jgi:hypothetical protein
VSFEIGIPVRTTCTLPYLIVLLARLPLYMLDFISRRLHQSPGSLSCCDMRQTMGLPAALQHLVVLCVHVCMLVCADSPYASWCRATRSRCRLSVPRSQRLWRQTCRQVGPTGLFICLRALHVPSVVHCTGYSWATTFAASLLTPPGQSRSSQNCTRLASADAQHGAQNAIITNH